MSYRKLRKKFYASFGCNMRIVLRDKVTGKTSVKLSKIVTAKKMRQLLHKQKHIFGLKS